MAKVKCRYCKQSIDRDTAYSEKNKMYFCDKDCHDKYSNRVIRSVAQKAKKEPKKPSDRRILTDLILEYYLEQGVDKSTINWSLETARIKNILLEHPDWKISGLTYTLQYMHDIEHVNLFNDMANCVMSLVPSYYVTASNYYFDSEKVKDAIEEFDLNIEPIVVKTSRGGTKKKYKKIPMDDIIGRKGND